MDEPELTTERVEEVDELLHEELADAIERQDSEQLLELVENVHAADLADAIEQMAAEHAAEVLATVDVETAADVLEELEVEHLAGATGQLSSERLADMLDEMSSDEAADLIGELEPERGREVLELMEADESADVEDLLAYATDTAGGIMQAEVLALNGDLTADETIAHIRELHLEADTPYYGYVVDAAGRLIGVLSYRQLLGAPADTPIRDIMVTPVISITGDQDQEEAARVMSKYDLLALPVVGAAGELVGVITADDVMEVIEEELEEDLYKFAGTADPGRPRPAWAAAATRLPVVLVCLVGDVAAGRTVLQHEHRLENLAALAAFLPAMMATGGNIGQQSLAKVLRQIASGTQVTPALWRAVWRESCIGVLMGAGSGLLLGGIAYLTVPHLGPGIAVLVFASLTITSVIAAVLGAAVPLTIERLKRDPAIASGPLITTLNDIISTTVYFALAVMMLHWLGHP